MKFYEVGTEKVKYCQDTLTIGQLKQLITLFHNLNLFDRLKETQFSASVLLNLLGTEIPSFLAIILFKEGTKLKDKIPKEFEEEIEFNIQLEQAVDIITDFFEITSLSLLWVKMEKLMKIATPTQMTMEKVEEKPL